MKRKILAALVVGLTSICFAQQHPETQHDTAARGHSIYQHDQPPHPVLSQDSTWAGVVVIVVLLGMFLPAAVIGPIARVLAPEDEPQTHSHHEPPGSHAPGHPDSAHEHHHGH